VVPLANAVAGCSGLNAAAIGNGGGRRSGVGAARPTGLALRVVKVPGEGLRKTQTRRRERSQVWRVARVAPRAQVNWTGAALDGVRWARLASLSTTLVMVSGQRFAMGLVTKVGRCEPRVGGERNSPRQQKRRQPRHAESSISFCRVLLGARWPAMRASAAQDNQPCRHFGASTVAVGSAAAALTVAIGSVVMRSRPGNEQRQREAQSLVERRLKNRVNGVALVLVISHLGQRASRNTSLSNSRQQPHAQQQHTTTCAGGEAGLRGELFPNAMRANIAKTAHGTPLRTGSLSPKSVCRRDFRLRTQLDS
jgi:hypothetical protein